MIATKGAATLGRITLGKHLERQWRPRRGEVEEKEERGGREGEEREERANRKPREIRVASRTECLDWPRRKIGRGLRGVELVQRGETRKCKRGKKESKVKGKHRGGKEEKGKTITN